MTAPTFGGSEADVEFTQRNTLAELQDAADDRGLDSSGTKAELIARLNGESPTDDRQWQVVSKGSMLLFAGTEDDARKFIQDNFPRVHTQPGSVAKPEADANLISPDGARSQWLTTTWKDVDA